MSQIVLAGFIGLVGGVALLGGKWGAAQWYKSLKKPSFTPPDWVFPVVWSILYIMIAASGWFIWKTPHPWQYTALSVWGVQLVLNGAWSYVFFGRKNIRSALFVLIALWISIAVYILIASAISTTAALLFVPYLVWVTIAGALNWRILQLNA